MSETPEPQPRRVDRSRSRVGPVTGTVYIATDDGKAAIPFLHEDDLPEESRPKGR